MINGLWLLDIIGKFSPPHYLDPGTGSYILQVIIAFLLGGVFVFRSRISEGFKKITGLFRRDKGQPGDGKPKS